MRITYIELLGTKYPMCFSNTASDMLAEEFGSMDEVQEAMTSNNPFKAINKVIKILIYGGIKYCDLAMIDHPPMIEYEPGDVLDMSDPDTIKLAFDAMTGGAEREVEVSEKKVTAKRGK